MKKLLLIFFILFLPYSVYADEYYLGQWVWDTSEVVHRWVAPQSDKNTGTLDLRSIPDQSIPGGPPQGYAIFTYSDKVINSDLTYLGDGKDSILSQKSLDTLKQNLKIDDLKSTKVSDVIYEIYTEKSDPTGQNGVKPLMPTQDMKLEINVGDDGVIKETTLIPFVSKEWDLVLKTIQNDYKKLVSDEPYEVVARVLDALEEQYSVDYRIFIPDDYPKIASLPHNTTITENWNCANSDNLDCNLDWTEMFNIVGDIDITSNQAELQSGNPYARAESNLSSANHYAQMEITVTFSGAEAQMGVAARYDPSSTSSSRTMYWGNYNSFSTPNHRLRIEKEVANTITGLAGPDTSAALASNAVCRLEVSGSNLTYKVNGTTYLTATDTAITGFVRTGIPLSYSSGGSAVGDNYEAGDLATAAVSLINSGLIRSGLIH